MTPTRYSGIRARTQQEGNPVRTTKARLAAAGVAVTLVAAGLTVYATGGIAGAGTASESVGPARPAGVVVEPGLPGSGRAAPQAAPGAIAVAQAHTGSGWMLHPLLVKVLGAASATKPQLTATTPPGYAPAQLQASLHLHGTGQGQTVAIVNAYDNPYIQRDLTRSSKQFGLPLPCTTPVTTGCFHLSV